MGRKPESIRDHLVEDGNLSQSNLGEIKRNTPPKNDLAVFDNNMILQFPGTLSVCNPFGDLVADITPQVMPKTIADRHQNTHLPLFPKTKHAMKVLSYSCIPETNLLSSYSNWVLSRNDTAKF